MTPNEAVDRPRILGGHRYRSPRKNNSHMDFIAQEKRDLRDMAGVVAIVVMASMFGTLASYPPSAFTVVMNLVGLLLNVPIFIMAVRITKRGTPAVTVLGVLVLLLAGVACVKTVKWVFQ